MIKRFINADFANTSEAYAKNFFLGKKNIVVPYINLDMMRENPISGNGRFVDYSYFIFKDVRQMLIGTKHMSLKLDFSSDISEDCITENIAFGGYKSIGAEASVICKDCLVYLPDNAKFSSELLSFIPIDTPARGRNITTEDVEDFLLLKNLPKEVKTEFLGEEICSFSIFEPKP